MLSSPAAPKQARAIATRAKLLDAAIAVLCEEGRGNLTTTLVARRAGVSQGALYKHFGSKHQLIAATTEHLFAGLFERFRATFAAGATEEDRVSFALRELWAIFLTPELAAVHELYVTARTDAPLRQALLPVVFRHRENLLTEARKLFPEAAASNPNFERAVDGVMCTMQGAAITASVFPHETIGSEVLEFLELVCRPQLEAPAGETP